MDLFAKGLHSVTAVRAPDSVEIRTGIAKPAVKTSSVLVWAIISLLMVHMVLKMDTHVLTAHLEAVVQAADFVAVLRPTVRLDAKASSALAREIVKPHPMGRVVAQMATHVPAAVSGTAAPHLVIVEVQHHTALLDANPPLEVALLDPTHLHRWYLRRK